MSRSAIRPGLVALGSAILVAGTLISSAAAAGKRGGGGSPPPPPPPPATPVTYSGDAQVVGVEIDVLSLLLDIPIDVNLVRAGPLPSTGGFLHDHLLTIGDPAPVQLLLTAEAAHALTTGNGYEAYSEARVAEVKLGLGPVLPTTLAIEATVLNSQAQASCMSDGGATASGTSQIANLKINGSEIPISGEPNQIIDLSPLAIIVINEQETDITETAASITVNALHVSLLPPNVPLSLSSVLTGDVIISRAHADIGNCAVTPPSCEATGTCPPCESLGTCPPCAMQDFVTGGGKASDGKISFSTHGGMKGTEFRNGHLNVVDRASNTHINTGDFFGYRDPTPTSLTRELKFYCAAGNGVCTITETDNGEPGTSDRWFLDANGYSAGSLSSSIAHGNIQLHQPRGCTDKSGGSTGGGGETGGKGGGKKR